MSCKLRKVDNGNEQNNRGVVKVTKADKSAPTGVQVILLITIIGGVRINLSPNRGFRMGMGGRVVGLHGPPWMGDSAYSSMSR